jgi:hypothetical protein
MKNRGGFARFASAAARMTGRAGTFALAGLVILVWAASGPLFGFSDTWQLVINTRHDDRHVPDGVPDPEHAEPRFGGDAGEARRD